MGRTGEATREVIEVVWRMEAPRLIGGLVRWVGDVGQAEDLAQEALLVALERWPATGVPENPGAWLMTTAKRRAIDERRRQAMIGGKHHELAITAEMSATLDEDNIDHGLEDDVLRLVLVACHPVLSREARVALTLRLVAGLSTSEVARAFLVSEVTMAQRIVRAKRALSLAKVAFEVPNGQELSARIPSVLEVVYLVFNEGYLASSTNDLMRPELCDEALRLGRMLAGLVPHDAEVHGLLSLMELQASRSRARVDANGEAVLLADQDRRRWDRLLITRGLAALARAESLAQRRGTYTLQAAIAACHARAHRMEDTDWPRIVALYQDLFALTGSPVVELNRAVAVSMVEGPGPALALVEALIDEPALRDYHLLSAVRGDLLLKLGRPEEARSHFERAAHLSHNARERSLLLARSARCADEVERRRSHPG